MVAPYIGRVEATIPAQATAATDERTVVARAPFNGSVTRVAYTPESDITGVNTNTRRFSLVNRGQDGNGAVEIAALQMNAGTNASDFDELLLTLNATPANLNVVAGDILEFFSDALATGITDPGGIVNIEFSRSTTPG